MTLDRREFLKSAALLAGGTLSVACTRALGELGSLAGEVPREPSVRVLDPPQRARLERAVDLILPATDTPGALDAGVPDFVEMMIADYYYDEERAVLVGGLDALEARARERHGGSFVALPEEAQIALLGELEQEGLAVVMAAGVNPLAMLTGGPPAPAPAFFQSLRELVAVGYSTSEVAARHGFEFSPMHAEFEACAPVDARRRTEVL